MLTDCPHELFQDNTRASVLKSRFDLDTVRIRRTENRATRMASFALQAVSNNKRRHDAVQRFMIANDSVTVAAKVPIYLTRKDVTYFRIQHGLKIPFNLEQTLSGHIDLVQIRNGSIRILDYKPNAAKEKPIQQLMSYALALASRTQLRLCSWILKPISTFLKRFGNVLSLDQPIFDHQVVFLPIVRITAKNSKRITRHLTGLSRRIFHSYSDPVSRTYLYNML
jgi:hypothetical protein